jgi:hypothetical protein
LEPLASKLDQKRSRFTRGTRARKSTSQNPPAFDLRTGLYRITGVDWSQINGIDVQKMQTVIAEAKCGLERLSQAVPAVWDCAPLASEAEPRS